MYGGFKGEKYNINKCNCNNHFHLECLCKLENGEICGKQYSYSYPDQSTGNMLKHIKEAHKIVVEKKENTMDRYIKVKEKPDKQKELEMDVLKAIISNNLSFSIVENGYFLNVITNVQKIFK